MPWARLITAFAIILAFASLLPFLRASAQEKTRSSPPGFARPIAGYEIVSSTPRETVPVGVTYAWAAECPTPKVVLGGGFILGAEAEFFVEANHPLVNNEGFYDGKFWRVQVKNVGLYPSTFTVYAMCALAAP
jgi:hypothetical protein